MERRRRTEVHRGIQLFLAGESSCRILDGSASVVGFLRDTE